MLYLMESLDDNGTIAIVAVFCQGILFPRLGSFLCHLVGLICRLNCHDSFLSFSPGPARFIFPVHYFRPFFFLWRFVSNRLAHVCNFICRLLCVSIELILNAFFFVGPFLLFALLIGFLAELNYFK